MTTTAELASFVQQVSADGLSEEVVTEIEKRILDSVGIAIGALGSPPTEAVVQTVFEVDEDGPCQLWGRAESASPPQAAMYNTALTRYLDYMDSFLAPGETPHPSDTIASAVACGEAVDATGRELIEGIGVAYEVQGELAWNAPVRDRGFDHVTHTVIAAACGAGKLLGLDHEQLRNAIGIAGTAHNALRVTRTGGINEWKGIASANAARNAVYACLLARNGMEGPTDLFEGQKGWKQVIASEFEVNLDPGCGHIFDTMTKRYVAETYAQSAVEGIIQIAEEYDIDPETVSAIHLETFHGAKLIIGGGEGSRYEVETKAQADHSLPYMLAAALADREMTSDQYDPARIQRDDVQRLLRRVAVEEHDDLTARFENGEMPAVLQVVLDDGTTIDLEKDAFQGHPSKPMSWAQIQDKYERLASQQYDERRVQAIQTTIEGLHEHDVHELTSLLE